MSTSDERDGSGFLARWSKRKLAPEKARQTAPAPESPEDSASSEIEGQVVATPEVEPFDLSLLPSIEDLTGESSVSMFMQSGVPEALKNAALRKVWSADPFIRDHTGPVDYGWNFNDPMSMPGFGPMGESTDMAMLLRQAIGEIEPVVEAPIDVAQALESEGVTAPPVQPSDTLMPAEAVQVLASQPENSVEIPAGDIALSVPVLPPDVETPEAALPSRRPKHGGAFPS